jgi:hypothetical protein
MMINATVVSETEEDATLPKKEYPVQSARKKIKLADHSQGKRNA